MNNKWSVSFLQNCPVDIQHAHSSDYSIGRNSFLEMKLHPQIFDVLTEVYSSETL